MQIHVARDGKELGAFSLDEINRQLAAGTLRETDLAWYEGAAGWAALSTVPGVASAPASLAAAVSPPVAATPTVVVSQRKSEQLALLSLIFSILGLFGFCCGFFLMGGIAGIICGHIALSRIKANPELEGHGLAMAGLVIGYVAVAGWLVWIILFGGLAVLQGISESMTKH
jgi:uncharacterized protein DUF4190/uncharacterized protein DUF4339